ncbi:polyubiquitin isoform X1 [Tanacetum coccineum]
MLQDKEGMPPYEQRFHFAKHLEDNHTLPITASIETLVHEYKGVMKITIIMTFSGNTTISLEVESSITVGHLKAKIQDEEGIRLDNHSVFFTGKQLEDSLTLADHNIYNNSILDLIPPMRINIMFVPTSENISVKVKETDTIDYVKAKIQSKIGVPIDKQRVKGKSIKTMDISPVSSEMMMISPMMLYGKTVNMEVNASVTMSWIKSIIEAKEGLPPNQYMLFLKGKQLNEDITLKNFELPIESTLYLLPNPRAKVQVLVEMMSGMTRVMNSEAQRRERVDWKDTPKGRCSCRKEA